MAFSQSFELGDSTFMQLESDLKSTRKEYPNNNNENQHANGLEIIQESPPNIKQKSYTQKNISKASQRRRFRRSKSDSKLGQTNTVSNGSCSQYSDFFKDDFSFPEKKTKEVEDSLMRVSQIQAALDGDEDEELADNLNTTSIFEAQICTEDVFNSEMEPNTEPAKEISRSPSPVELANLDESSFLCPAKDAQASHQLREDLRRSHSVLTKQIDDYQCQQETPKMTQNLSTMSPSQLRLSPNNSSTLNRTPIEKKDLPALKQISAWSLPHSVLNEYKKKGVIQMFDWQVECLSNSKVLFEHANLVYSAPTSAGKTLVSEILLLKTVLERNKKVLLILPFISVVREKMFYLQDLLTPAGYRVEGFFGGYTPPGGFESIHVAICTIEKANSIVNKLLEQGKLDEIGTVVVDEVHLISDPGRGYILELLLAKILYMSRKNALQIQVITMSATLANVQLLQHWLDAELYITNYRPVALQEMIKVGTKIYDNQLRFVRDIMRTSEVPARPDDGDHVAQLCIETLLEGCSVVVFCPSKDWCENLAVQLATAMHTLIKSDNHLASKLRSQLNTEAIEDVKRQLRDIPTGLDAVMSKAVTYACAFHHAGLTTEERDIVEASFKAGALKVIVATSTLSSGVNLPARRVLIRSPLFGGKQMSSLTYRQMIGRAGRTGKDTLGESILICSESNARVGRELVTAQLKPIKSCLDMDGSTHLKRALLEVISSGVASSREDIDRFVNCTLLSAQNSMQQAGEEEEKEDDTSYVCDALDFLVEYEFIRLQTDEETDTQKYVATRLGAACLASSMPPTDGLILFAELQKSRRCFVLESELHAVYLVTPYSVCYQLQDVDWLLYLDMWEKLNPAMKKVGELVGVKEAFLVRAMRGQTKLDYKLMQVHKRFYTALALQELVNETPINVVAHKFKCQRGMLQSLQQMASTFAGIVTAFCNSLQWSTLSLIVSQFKDRLYFGIHRDLIDLMRLPDLTHKRARILHDAGITTLVELAGADVLALEQLLYNSLSFDLVKQHENENQLEAEQRNTARNFFITGKAGITVAEAAKLLIAEARQFVQYEIGVGSIQWTQQGKDDSNISSVELQMSLEEQEPQKKKRIKKTKRKKAVEELHMSLEQEQEEQQQHGERQQQQRKQLQEEDQQQQTKLLKRKTPVVDLDMSLEQDREEQQQPGKQQQQGERQQKEKKQQQRKQLQQEEQQQQTKLIKRKTPVMELHMSVEQEREEQQQNGEQQQQRKQLQQEERRQQTKLIKRKTPVVDVHMSLEQDPEEQQQQQGERQQKEKKQEEQKQQTKLIKRKTPVVELHMSLEQERKEQQQQQTNQIKRKTPDRDMSPEQLSPCKIRKLHPGDQLKQVTQPRTETKEFEKPELVAKVENPLQSLNQKKENKERHKFKLKRSNETKTQILNGSENSKASKPRQKSDLGNEDITPEKKEYVEKPNQKDEPKKEATKPTPVSKVSAQNTPAKALASVPKTQESSEKKEDNRLPTVGNPTPAVQEELPTTSAACRKELIKKQMEERRRIALMKINKRRAEMENQATDAMSGKATPPPLKCVEAKTQETSSKINEKPKEHPVQEHPVQENPPASAAAPEQDLFTGEDSFMLSTGLNAALTAAERKSEPEADEIPSSQPKDVEAVATPRLMRSYQQRSQRRNSFRPTPTAQAEVASNPTPAPPSPPTQAEVAPNPTSAPPSPPTQEADTASSMEISNMSVDNSLIKHPTQLNASHILSCSKTDEHASSFSSVDIVDICGNRNIFKLAMDELQRTKRCGFSIGLQHQAGKRKPLIGANLLINQVAAAEEREAAAGREILFQLDDSCFLAGIAFSQADNVVYYMNLQQEDHHEVDTMKKLQYLYKLLERTELTILIHDGKEQLKALRRAMPDLKSINVKLEDPKVGNWLLQPDQTLSFHNMCQQFAPECAALARLCGSGRGYSSFGLDASSAIMPKVRASIEACVTVHILNGQIENLERIGTGQLLRFFRELEMPIQVSLYKMECIGFPAKESRLQRLFQQMVATMKKLETKIYELHGSRFNLGSTQAVAKVVGLHRKANGRVSTSRQILEKIDSPISQLILSYRKLSMLLSKNMQPLLKCCQENRVHGQSITFTATGRISMTEPNLQNVAKDFEIELANEKLKISCRSAFAPMEEKRCLLSADFCQLEMRILAHLSQDEALVKVMNSQQDLFTAIAAHWNKISESEVSEQLRNGTKQICYGIVYGMGMRSLAESLKCTEQEAQMLSEQFHLAYPGIKVYTMKVVKFARNNGYVETITGRRRYLDHINSGEPQLKNQAERQAINSTIQGSAADIAKSAILRMEKNIERYREKLGLAENSVHLVLHLHDELIFEVPTEKAKKIAKVLSLTMENSVKLTVPLRVKLKIGRSWGELQEVKV